MGGVRGVSVTGRGKVVRDGRGEGCECDGEGEGGERWEGSGEGCECDRGRGKVVRDGRGQVRGV